MSNENMNISIMSEDEHFLYQTNGTQPPSLQGTIDVQYQSLKINYEIIEKDSSSKNYYMLIQNNHEEQNLNYYYYIGIVPQTYYKGLLIGFLGIIGLIIVLTINFQGIKRFFTLGIGINLLAIMIRMATLGKYNPFNFQLYYDFIIQYAITPELWNDYEAWYLPWIDPFLQGQFPYGESIGYEFPPLFIITLAFFKLLPLIPLWKTGIPIFISHLMSGVIIYLIMKELYPDQERKASIGMLIYYLNPISLAYGAFCWLNPPIFSFFVVLSFYLVIKQNQNIKIGKYNIPAFYLAMVTLAIGTMYKQFAFIFFIPLLLINYYRNSEAKIENFLSGSVFYGLTIIIICLPFLIIDPISFLRYTLFTPTVISIGWSKHIFFAFPTNFNSFFVAFYFPDFITDIIGFLIIWWIPLVISMIIVYINIRSELKNKTINRDSILVCWLVILLICVHLFYPRGTFKYYLLYLMPFFSLFIGKINYKNKTNGIVLLLIGFIVLINRYIYFNILIIIVGFVLYQIIQMRNKNTPIEPLEDTL